MGGIDLLGANTFTGTITARSTLGAYNTGWGQIVGVEGLEQTTAGASPFGSAAGNVVLTGGEIRLDGASGGQMVNKNSLTYSGADMVAIYANGSTAQLTFASMTPADNGSLVIWPISNSLGTNEKLFVTAAPTLTNGMVSPSIVSATGWNTGNFVTYGASEFRQHSVRDLYRQRDGRDGDFGCGDGNVGDDLQRLRAAVGCARHWHGNTHDCQRRIDPYG